MGKNPYSHHSQYVGDEYTDFLEKLDACRSQVKDYLNQSKFKNMFSPPILNQAVYSYIERMGKAMRPAVVLWSAGALGGSDRVSVALPAAACIEVFHTYTLVHDDILDRDAVRRGGPTVHSEYSEYAKEQYNLSEAEASHFGNSIGILAGDSQLCWSITLLSEYLHNAPVSPEVTRLIFTEYTEKLLPSLPAGETLDLLFALENPGSISPEQVIEMYYRKTAVTFEVSAKIGAAIGANTSNLADGTIDNIADFARLSGIAFQLYDDILGVVGNNQNTQKPVGADIIEGKRTFLILYALTKADKKSKDILLKTLGNRQATDSDVQSAIDILTDIKAIEHTQEKAREYLSNAQLKLDNVRDSEYKTLLSQWCQYVVDRIG